MSQVSSINNAVQSLGLKRDFVVAAIEHAKLTSLHTTGTGKRGNVLYYNWEELQAAIEAYKEIQPQVQVERAVTAARNERLESVEHQLVTLTQSNEKVAAQAADVIDQSRKLLEQGRLTYGAVARFSQKIDNVTEQLVAASKRSAQLDTHVLQLITKVQNLEARLSGPTTSVTVALHDAPPGTTVTDHIARIVHNATVVPAVEKLKVAVLGIWPANEAIVAREFGDCFDLRTFNNEEITRSNFNVSFQAYDKVFLVMERMPKQMRRSIERDPLFSERAVKVGSMSALKGAMTEFYIASSDKQPAL